MAPERLMPLSDLTMISGVLSVNEAIRDKASMAVSPSSRQLVSQFYPRSGRLVINRDGPRLSLAMNAINRGLPPVFPIAIKTFGILMNRRALDNSKTVHVRVIGCRHGCESD